MKTTAADTACALSMLAAARRCVARAEKCRRLGQAMHPGSPQRAGLARSFKDLMQRSRNLIYIARDLVGKPRVLEICWPRRDGKPNAAELFQQGFSHPISGLWIQQFGRAKRRESIASESLSFDKFTRGRGDVHG